MKLITDSNLELVVSKFYDRIVEEFSVADSAHKLETGRTLTIGETAQFFDGTQDLFWSLTDIGIGSPSNLNTSNKSNLVNAINELNTNKASIAYVDNAVENVSIDDAVTAVELVGNVEDIEIDYVTQSELEEALSNLDDIDIDGMVTAVDVGNVDIEQGGGNGGGVDESVIGQLSSLQTANKTNLVEAINELFQNANNGKELIATAIGSPLSSSDTFSAMSTKINNLTTSFKSALLNKGVAISGTDTFQSLITKIESIDGGSSNTGTMFKTGELALSPVMKTFSMKLYEIADSSDVQESTEQAYCFMFETDFVPTIFNATLTIDLGTVGFTIRYNYDSVSNSNAVVICDMSDMGMMLESNLVREGNMNYIPDVLIQTSGGPGGEEGITYTMTYTAIGIGEVGDDPALLESLKSVLTEEGVSTSSSDTIATLITKVDAEFDRKNGLVPKNMDKLPSWYSPIMDFSNSWIPFAEIPGYAPEGAPIPYDLIARGSALLNNKIYLISGGIYSYGMYPMDAIDIYDTTSNTWTRDTNNAPYSIANVAACAIGNYIYTFGGYDASTVYDLTYRYSPPGSWSGGGWQERAYMPYYLYGATCQAVSNQAYVIGGYDNEYALSTNLCYNPSSNSWTEKSTMSRYVTEPCSAVINNQIYVVGGYDPYNSQFFNQNSCYNPTSNSWTEKRALPTVIYSASAAACNNKMYVMGGVSDAYNYVISNATYCYDPGTNSWTTKATVPSQLFMGGAHTANNCIYYVAATDLSYTTTYSYCYIP